MTIKNSGALIKIEDLTIEYYSTKARKRILLFDSFCLSIPCGGHLAVIGDSGAGKSTLLDFITGFIQPTGNRLDKNTSIRNMLFKPIGDIYVQGRVLIGHDDITSLEPRHRPISMLMQNFTLYPHMTVRENIAFPLKLRKTMKKAKIEEAVTKAAESVHIYNLLNDRPIHLSGGERQRVAIAKILLMDPTVAILDEAFSNLDPILRKDLRQLVHTHYLSVKDTERALICVTHEMLDALDATHILLLRKQIDKSGQKTLSHLIKSDDNQTAWQKLVTVDSGPFREFADLIKQATVNL